MQRIKIGTAGLGSPCIRIFALPAPFGLESFSPRWPYSLSSPPPSFYSSLLPQQDVLFVALFLT